MDSRSQLKTRFSKGQRVGESDFHSLIESLSHVNEDVASGVIASGSSVTSLSSKLDELKAFAEAHKSDYDSYKGNHPTLEQVEARDEQLSQTFAGDIQAIGTLISSLSTKDTEIENDVSQVESDLASEVTSNSQAHDIINASIATKASSTDLQAAVDALEALIDAKANTAHTHPEYVLKTEANHVTQADLDAKANASHQHTASEITGLDDLFTTPTEVLSLINDNKIKIDERSLLDDFYNKADVDEKVRIFMNLMKDQVLSIVDAKIAQLQESINNLTPPNPYTLFDIDPVEAQALSGVEASRVSIFATSPISGLVLTGVFEGGVLPEVSISNPGNYYGELFVGTTNTDQLIAYNTVEDQWEWIELANGVQKLIASYETTDYSVVPEYWVLDPIGDYGTTPTSDFQIQVSQTSDSDLVEILDQARYFSVDYVSQGLNYVKKAA